MFNVNAAVFYLLIITKCCCKDEWCFHLSCQPTICQQNCSSLFTFAKSCMFIHKLYPRIDHHLPKWCLFYQIVSLYKKNAPPLGCLYSITLLFELWMKIYLLQKYYYFGLKQKTDRRRISNIIAKCNASRSTAQQYRSRFKPLAG